ncbi:MAG: ATP-binding protein [Chitinophagaceae bacterium]
MNTSTLNITRSLAFLQDVINRRLQQFFHRSETAVFTYPELILEPDSAPLNQLIAKQKMNIEEYVILLLALAPHLQPSFLDGMIQQYLPGGGDFPEIGGAKGTNYRGTLATGETALFILAGDDLNRRLHALQYFSEDHFFVKESILQLESVKEGEPRMSGKLVLQQEYVDLLTIGSASKPSFGPDFPAKLVTTRMHWDDLVLNPKTVGPINDIKIWLEHNNTLLYDWGMERKIKPGYRALFYGPSGTGKTLTATLLGKQFCKDVYRVDLSQVVSKYVGETEKNLEKIFNKAERRDWILFFDEADALFGKRSNVQNAHDKYANQEVSYLLQRVEDFPGLIILASNFKGNIDQAFLRRFSCIIHFPMPNHEERHKIWKASIPPKAALAEDIDLSAIAGKYELSGSAILSVVHYASLQTICVDKTVITRHHIIEGIRKEFEKEERVFT